MEVLPVYDLETGRKFNVGEELKLIGHRFTVKKVETKFDIVKYQEVTLDCRPDWCHVPFGIEMKLSNITLSKMV